LFEYEEENENDGSQDQLVGEDNVGENGSPIDPYYYMDGELDEDLEDIKFIFRNRREGRQIKERHERINWRAHVERLIRTNQFVNRFRMEPWMFQELEENIQDAITMSIRHSQCSTSGNEPIFFPEIVVACGLGFCNGDSIPSIADIYGLSVPSTRRVINMFLDAIDYNETYAPLQVRLPDPNDVEQLADLAQRWEEVSTAFGLFKYHIGPLDRLLPRTEKPRGVPNSGDYFSGHYQRYGLNCQEMSDPDLVFMYFAVAGSGKTNDIRALSRLLELRQWFDHLPEPYFCSADAAYPLFLILTSACDTQLLLRFHRVLSVVLSTITIFIETIIYKCKQYVQFVLCYEDSMALIK
jgi:hypothetical protein